MRRFPTTVLSGLFLIISGVAVPAAPATGARAPSPGTVVSSTPVALPPIVAQRGTAVRITYNTTSITGAPITAAGLVITPSGHRAGKTVAWGHGTTGLADQCAPSQNQNVFWPEAREAVAELLSRGWTVAAPDFPGLGIAGPHPYLVGGSEGRAMIDAVRAARNLDRELTAQYAVDGHSQGGQGALFAGELAPSYDGSLVLRGVAAIAPASNVDALAPLVPGTAAQGYLVMGVLGLAAVDPSVNPDALFAAPAKQKAVVLQTGCLDEILDAYAPLTAAQLLNGGALPDADVEKLADNDNPAQRPPSAPILIVQGTADEAVPEFVTDLLVDQLHEYDQPVRVVKLQGANHDEAVFQSVGLVADWIASQFD